MKYVEDCLTDIVRTAARTKGISFTDSSLENQALEANQDCSENHDLLSEAEKIYIHDYSDKAEVTIKQKLVSGEINLEDVFKGGFTEIYKKIGFENLGIKSLKGGKQKNIAKENLLQYLQLQSVQNKKRALQLVDVYEVPRYIEKIDRRGKNGFYKERVNPILLDYFSKQDRNTIFTSVTDLAKIIGLVNRNYRKISYKELVAIDSRYTKSKVNDLYYRCKPLQEDIIFKALDTLQNEYRLIDYYNNHYIFTESGNHTSTQLEDKLIRKMERKVMNEYGYKMISSVFRHKQEKAFYSRVVQLINEQLNTDWIGYRKQIQIDIDTDDFLETIHELNITNESIMTSKREVSERFIQRVQNRTEYDYQRTNGNADMILDEWNNTEKDIWLKKYPKLKELEENGIVDIEKFKPKPFRYYEDYLEIEYELINLLLRTISNQAGNNEDIENIFG
ncbi:MAG TPA: hypothetical protein IAC41_01420 [Candidatus Merdenecus merdavium]|nr:hypothetical protein [Candidatus Merdenecus merdavium]